MSYSAVTKLSVYRVISGGTLPTWIKNN